jgi:cysteine desulfurase
MLPYLGEVFGNPSSPHGYGRRARAGLDEARERIAARLNARPREIVLTSGGTEALNLGLKGIAWAGKARGHRIVTSAVEHHSVGHVLLHLEKFGFETVTVPVDRYGRVDPDEVERALTDRTILVAVQLANNEVGTIQPVAEIARRVHARKGILMAVDAIAAAPYLALDVDELGADLLAIAGHKFEGPKGAGALYLRHGTNILAQQHGGTQERYRRAGTEDVAAAVGMAAALDLAVEERERTAARLRSLRGRLARAVVGAAGTELTGHPVARLPGLLSVVAPGLDGAALVMALDLAGVAVSVGSACTTGSLEPSHVLTAMGYPAEEARGALRLSLGRATTAENVEAVAAIVTAVLADQRAAAAELAADPLGAVAAR